METHPVRGQWRGRVRIRISCCSRLLPSKGDTIRRQACGGVTAEKRPCGLSERLGGIIVKVAVELVVVDDKGRDYRRLSAHRGLRHWHPVGGALGVRVDACCPLHAGRSLDNASAPADLAEAPGIDIVSGRVLQVR